MAFGIRRFQLTLMRRPCCINRAHQNHRFPDQLLSTPPQPQRLDGWPLAAGNQPVMTRVDDSKRPREDPARRGEQGRSGRWFTAKKCMPTNNSYSRASERAHGAASRCGPHRSNPWSYGCGEGEAKGSNRCTSAHLGLVYFCSKCGIS